MSRNLFTITITFALFTLIVGCSDFTVTAVPPLSDESPDDPVDEPEEDDLTEYLRDVAPAQPDDHWDFENDEPEQDECGQWIYDGFFSHEEDVYVESVPQVTLISPDEISVLPGMDVNFRFQIDVPDCGDVEVFSFFLLVQDVEDIDWLNAINEDRVPMSLTEITTGQEFLPYAAWNKEVTPTGDELHYVWRADHSIYVEHNYGETMTSRLLESGSSTEYEFIFSGTDYASEGTTFDVSLVDFEWIDLTTGEYIWDHTTMFPTWTYVTVQ